MFHASHKQGGTYESTVSRVRQRACDLGSTFKAIFFAERFGNTGWFFRQESTGRKVSHHFLFGFVDIGPVNDFALSKRVGLSLLHGPNHRKIIDTTGPQLPLSFQIGDP